MSCQRKVFYYRMGKIKQLRVGPGEHQKEKKISWQGIHGGTRENRNI